MTSLTNLLKDPPPTHAFELSEAGIAFARVSEPKQVNFMPFDPGVLLVSPAHDNIHQPQAVLDHIHAIAPPNGHRKRRAALILPDYCARIAVLDFDNFPTDPEQQLALLRFRMKKSVPFDVDSAIVSYLAQPRKKDKEKIEVLAAVMSAEIVGRYEGPFRETGFHPGLVTTSSLAALNLIRPEQITTDSVGAGSRWQRHQAGALRGDGRRTAGGSGIRAAPDRGVYRRRAEGQAAADLVVRIRIPERGLC